MLTLQFTQSSQKHWGRKVCKVLPFVTIHEIALKLRHCSNRPYCHNFVPLWCIWLNWNTHCKKKKKWSEYRKWEGDRSKFNVSIIQQDKKYGVILILTCWSTHNGIATRLMPSEAKEQKAKPQCIFNQSNINEWLTKNSNFILIFAFSNTKAIFEQIQGAEFLLKGVLE